MSPLNSGGRYHWRVAAVALLLLALNGLGIALIEAMPVNAGVAREPVAVVMPVNQPETRQIGHNRFVSPPSRGIFVSAGGRTGFQFPRPPASSNRQSPPRPNPDDVLFIRPFGVLQPGQSGAALYFASLAATIGTGLVLFILFPRRLSRISTAMHGSIWHVARLAAIGIVSIVGLSSLLVLLFIVVMGIPVAVAFLAGAAVVITTGIAAVCLALGRRLSAWMRLSRRIPALDLVLGALLLLPLTLIPWAGWLLAALAAIIGLGAVVFTRFGGEGWAGSAAVVFGTPAESTIPRVP